MTLCLGSLWHRCCPRLGVVGELRAGVAAQEDLGVVGVVLPAVRALVAGLAVVLDEVDGGSFGEYREYWKGFALWRRALNGFNETPTPSDLAEDLEKAIVHFRRSLDLRPNWIEARIGIVGCGASLLFLAGNDEAKKQALRKEFVPMLQAVQKEGGENPRALWLIGGMQFGAPPPMAAISPRRRRLTHGLRSPGASRRPGLPPPWAPTWGGRRTSRISPHLVPCPRAQQEPGVAYAQGAITAAPDWHYVKDILLPQIQKLPETAAEPPRFSPSRRGLATVRIPPSAMRASQERQRSSRATWFAYAGFWFLLACVYGGARFERHGLCARAPRHSRRDSSQRDPGPRVARPRAARDPSRRPGGRAASAILAVAVAAVAVVATLGWLALVASMESCSTAQSSGHPGRSSRGGVVNTLIHFVLGRRLRLAGRRGGPRGGRSRVPCGRFARARAELQLFGRSSTRISSSTCFTRWSAWSAAIRRAPRARFERLGDLLKFGQWFTRGADFVPLSRSGEFVQSYSTWSGFAGRPLVRDSHRGRGGAAGSDSSVCAQPLVENAILHAVAPRASGGRVDVSASRSEGWLCLAVSDDGPGTTEAAVAASPRLGLRLLQERLGALYGGRARLTYETPVSGGFRVRVDLPDGLTPEAA